MPDHSERYIKIYDLTVSPARVHGSPSTMLKASDFDRLSRAVKAAAAARVPLGDDEDSRRRKLYLMDMDVRRHHVTLVWTLADPNAAAQMYLKHGGTGLRAAPKDDDEDVALSAHMVIDFDVPQNTMRYRVALEDHEGVSRTRIQVLFQTLLQENMPSVTAVLAEGVTKPGPPRVHLDAHPGRLIGQTATKPVEIDVVKLTPRRTMTAGTSDPFYQAMDRRVFKLGRDGAVAELRDRAIEKARELRRDYPEHTIRIRWQDPHNPDNKKEVTRLDPLDRPERLLERAMTREVHLSGFRNLPQATNTIVARLADRMLEAIRETAAEDARTAKRRRQS